MRVVDTLADRRLAPRRSWFGLLVESYTSSGSFRGFLDFAVFGAVVLLFLHPPDVSAWLGRSGAATTNSGMNVGSGSMPVQTAVAPPPAPSASGTPGPSSPGASGSPPAAKPPLKVMLERFLALSEPTHLPKLQQAIDMVVQGRMDEAADILGNVPDTDPNRHFIHAVGHVKRGDHAAALAAHRRAAELGHPSAMYEAAQMLRLGRGAAPDRAVAFDYYRQAYDKGFDEAGTQLVFHYYLLADVSFRDYAKARQINEALAAKGNRSAINNLGVQYAKGQGVAENPAKAVELFRKSAELGYTVAMSNLGSCYLEGDGIARDPAAGVSWLQKAAEQNYLPALFRLGKAYLDGETGPADPVLAGQYLRKAAMQNHAASQLLLGTLYEEGRGIGRDLVQAYLFYGLARARGEAEAGRRLAGLEGKLTGAERERAHRLLDGALPKKP